MQQEIIAEIQKEKQELDAQKVAAELLPASLPAGWYPYTDVFNRGFVIRIPWGDVGLYRIFRRTLGRGWKFVSSDTYDCGDRHILYQNGQTHLTVCIKPPTSDNPTCQLVQIGEKTEPIYEVRCS